jgi:hypothetical protein
MFFVVSVFCSIVAPTFIMPTVLSSGPARLLALDSFTSLFRLFAYSKLLSLHAVEPGATGVCYCLIACAELTAFLGAYLRFRHRIKHLRKRHRESHH